MRKLSGLILMAILTASICYAEESQGAICENNGGRWYWNGGSNQWQCDKDSYPRSHESLFESAKRKCRSGSTVNCSMFGQMAVEGIDLENNKVPQDIALGMQLLTETCNAGNLSSCNSIGLYYKDGKYFQENKYKAAQIFQTVCDAGERGVILSPSGYGCFYLGIMTANGEGVPKNKSKAHELYNKACALGIRNGCDFARSTQ